jgi:hypothetical protein
MNNMKVQLIIFSAFSPNFLLLEAKGSQYFLSDNLVHEVHGTSQNDALYSVINCSICL